MGFRHGATLNTNHVKGMNIEWKKAVRRRVTWGKAPPFGDDLSLTYLFASTSEKSYMYVTINKLYVMCIMTEYHIRSDNISAEIRLLIAALKMSQILSCGAKRPGGL